MKQEDKKAERNKKKNFNAELNKIELENEQRKGKI